MSNMSNAKTTAVVSLNVLCLLSLLGAVGGCAATNHAVVPAGLGTPVSGRAFEAAIDEPGPVAVETVVGADWKVPLSGLLNLDHPKAKAAGKVDRDEPIQIAFHALHHPSRGLYLVDTGVEEALFDAPSDAAVRGIVASVMKVEDMSRRIDTAAWIGARPVAGVFLTHLHVDHVSGLRDVPSGAAVYVGPGEARARSVENFFTYETTDLALEGKRALSELRFAPDPDGLFAGVLDVFGDRTVFAIHVPGHTPGSTAFVARTPSGPELLTGDACHTTWGWENGVEPGSFSSDRPRSAKSLATLRELAARHPKMAVRVGHQ